MDQTKTPQNFLHSCQAHLARFFRSLRRVLHETKVTFLASFTKWVDPRLEKYRTPESQHHTSRTSQHTSSVSTFTPSSNQFTSSSAQLTSAQTANLTEINSAHSQLTPDSSQLTSNSEQFTPDTKELTSSSSSHSSDTQTYTPRTIEDFLALMKRTPRTVLDSRSRHVIATIMNFPSVRVSEIMLPPSAITYVHDDEVLGPLTLDRLYKSGFQHFPVIDSRHRIIGLIHTTALNSLEIKQTSHARDILDPKVYYLRNDYTLNQALAAFLRTNCYFFIVVDHYERIVGMLTYQMLIDYLLGETPSDKFDRDSDRLAVAKRKN